MDVGHQCFNFDPWTSTMAAAAPQWHHELYSYLTLILILYQEITVMLTRYYE